MRPRSVKCVFERSGEQETTQFSFQFLDGAGQRRLRDTQLLGGLLREVEGYPQLRGSNRDSDAFPCPGSRYLAHIRRHNE